MKHCENCKCEEVERVAEYRRKAEIVEERLARGDKFTDDELHYAAYSRCPCGAGLAYPKDVGAHGGYWDCSAILKRESDPAVTHTGKLPFVFYEIKGENQPSTGGATTRPRLPE